MAEELDREERAREQARAIKESLAKARLAYVSEAHAMTLTNDREKLKTLAMRREAIEALEYALKCAPPEPARASSVHM